MQRSIRRRISYRAIGIAVVVCIGPLTHAVEPTEGQSEATLDRFIADQMQRSVIPGAAVVIVDREGSVYAAGFGRTDSRISIDIPFLIGSVSKTFTALAIAQLVDDGRLRFDDRVVDRLPGFALADTSSSGRITIRHLLTHTSGLSQWSGHDRRAQETALFNHISPSRPPGEGFEYSSLNYIILGQIIEAVSDVSYSEFVQRRIFDPLEMRSSFVYGANGTAGVRELVRGHAYLFGFPLRLREPFPPPPLAPAGFIASSARDLGSYLSMLLNDGSFRGRQIVSVGSLREMFTPWGGDAAGPGMAWGVGGERIGHAGNTRTFSARLVLLSKEGRGIVLLTNVNSGPFVPGSGALMSGIVDAVEGRKPSIAVPYEILLKIGILVLVLIGAIRTFFRFRRWQRLSHPPPRFTMRTTPIFLLEIAAAIAVVLVIPRWVGVPLLTIVGYFPDLGIAMIAGVITGVTGALLKSAAAHATSARL